MVSSLFTKVWSHHFNMATLIIVMGNVYRTEILLVNMFIVCICAYFAVDKKAMKSWSDGYYQDNNIRRVLHTHYYALCT